MRTWKIRIQNLKDCCVYQCNKEPDKHICPNPYATIPRCLRIVFCFGSSHIMLPCVFMAAGLRCFHSALLKARSRQTNLRVEMWHLISHYEVTIPYLHFKRDRLLLSLTVIIDSIHFYF